MLREGKRTGTTYELSRVPAGTPRRDHDLVGLFCPTRIMVRASAIDCGALPLLRPAPRRKIALVLTIEGEATMFKTILWATDGSNNADRALPYAKGLAQQEGAKLVVAHVVEKYASHKASGLAVHADEPQVKAKLKKLVAQLADEGVNADLTIVSHVGPQPAHQIADLAREPQADLILMGSRGHTAITGLMLGSVTLRLLHVSPCPVMVIPPVETPASAPADREVAQATSS